MNGLELSGSALTVRIATHKAAVWVGDLNTNVSLFSMELLFITLLHLDIVNALLGSFVVSQLCDFELSDEKSSIMRFRKFVVLAEYEYFHCCSVFERDSADRE